MTNLGRTRAQSTCSRRPLLMAHIAQPGPKDRMLRPNRTQEPTIEQKRAALFGVTAVHASFGDVELAQMTLRGARGRVRQQAEV